MNLKMFTAEVVLLGSTHTVTYDGAVLIIAGVKTADSAMALLGVARAGYPQSWDEPDGPADKAATNGATNGAHAKPDESPTNGAHAKPPEQLQLHPDIDTEGWKARDAHARATTDKARADSKLRAEASLAASLAEKERQIAEAQDVALKAARAKSSAGPRGRAPEPEPVPAATGTRAKLPSDEAEVAPEDIPFGAETLDRSHEEAAAPAPPESAGDEAASFLAGLVAQTSIRGVIQHFHANGIDDRNEIIEVCKAQKKLVPALSRVSNIDDRLGRALEALEAT